MVERQDIDSCLVYGGQQMILTGQNFTAESKVVFTEKTSGKAVFSSLSLMKQGKSAVLLCLVVLSYGLCSTLLQ